MKMKNKKTPQWLPVLQGFASFFFLLLLLISSAQALADHTGDSDGGTRIDCGARENYTDWEADDGRFVEFGEVHNVSSNYNKEQIGYQLNTSRSFPEGKRNCYSVPKSSKNTYHLVRAFFAYGSYNNKTTIPSFDLYIGVNYRAKVTKKDEDIVLFEVIHVSSPDDNIINVCLVNTGNGTPFISLLEVLPWQNSRYDQTAASLLSLVSRSKLGMSAENATYIRYTDDIYGRSWFNRQMRNSERINASMAIDSNTDENIYKLPQEVLSSAVQPGRSSSSLLINMTYPHDDYYVYLHFYDFENKSQKKQRKMVIAFSDGVDVSFTLEYLKPTTLVRNIKKEYLVSSISIRSECQLPPMLNAYEIYRVLPQNSTTDGREVAAIRDIKKVYGIKRISWQGDPCLPMDYTWEGLNCSNNGTPRITSINLSSSNLSGVIADSFSNFTELTALDLSNNNLTGQIPEFLAELEKLKYINLTSNKLTGKIPKCLEEKKKTRNLTLSTDFDDHGMSTGEKIGIAVGATGGAAVVSGATLTFALRFPLCRGCKKTRSKGHERRGQNDDERRSGKREEEPRDEESDTEGGGVTVKPTITESLVSKASEAISSL